MSVMDRMNDETICVTVTLNRLDEDRAEFHSLGNHHFAIDRTLWVQLGSPIALDMPLVPWWPRQAAASATQPELP